MAAPKLSAFAALVTTYLKRIAHAAGAPGASPELSFRPALAEFLEQTVKLQKKENALHLSHEALADGADQHGKKIGRPDFILFAQKPAPAPVGYCEAESIDADLRKLTGHALHQNERYRKNLDNFLLTNHLSFELWIGGQRVEKADLPDPRTLEQPDQSHINHLERILERFFSSHAASNLPQIKDPRDLAEALARRTRQLHAAVVESLAAGSKYLLSLKDTFQKVLLPNLPDEEFADLYAQTVAYGLFAARCAVQVKNNKGQHQPFDRQHAVEYIPASNPFLRELFDHVSSHKIEEAVRWITDDIARLLDAAPYVSIRPHSNSWTQREDPVIHFYETFLAAYDPKKREARGVYYTPEPAVSYIVRSVDELIKSRLGRKAGLADPAVKILDPATGTGTFLAQTVLHIHGEFEKAGNAGAFDADYVENKLIPRLFGFELMVAPYTVAHLKLNLLLTDLVPAYVPKRRLEVFLTNSLEPPQAHPELPLSEFISYENNHAAQIKANENILVVMGNPPYSGHSANNGKEIKALLHGVDPLGNGKNGNGKKHAPQPNYFMCDGKPLGERNPKWLNDDYVKFIRFAQWRIDRSGEGVLGFITNHGYLDNPTFRGMRQALMQSFSEIHILDLHGNDRKKEVDPATGLKDENIFAIQQGVAIILAVKKKDHAGPCQVFHAELFGKRLERDSKKRNAPIIGGKYGWLWGNSNISTNWLNLEPLSPKYLFKPEAKDPSNCYPQFHSLKQAFNVSGPGIVTARDSLTMHMTREECLQAAKQFRELDDDTARIRFKLGSDSSDWTVQLAQADLKGLDLPAHLHQVTYRPLNWRYTIYTGQASGFHCRPRPESMKHLLPEKTLGLICPRQAKDDWGVLATSSPAGHKACSAYDINSVFPLYLYPAEGESDAEAHPVTNRRPNFSEAFLADFAAALKKKRVQKPERAAALTKGDFVQYAGLPEGVSPEDIFHYAYAVLHSPEYRTRYAEFLKMDFPRLPLPGSEKLFRALAAEGGHLTALHLLDADKAPELHEMRHGYPVSGSSVVEPKFPKWKPTGHTTPDGEALGIVQINEKQHFLHVPESTWLHRIGGYQVAEKWLKDRRERTLTADDRAHYQRTLTALTETRRHMSAIDAIISAHGGWPGAFAVAG